MVINLVFQGVSGHGWMRRLCHPPAHLYDSDRLLHQCLTRSGCLQYLALPAMCFGIVERLEDGVKDDKPNEKHF